MYFVWVDHSQSPTFSRSIVVIFVLYKRRREEAENGVVLHGGLYGPPYELPVGQNGGHGFSGKVISIIHLESFSQLNPSVTHPFSDSQETQFSVQSLPTLLWQKSNSVGFAHMPSQRPLGQPYRPTKCKNPPPAPSGRPGAIPCRVEGPSHSREDQK